MHPIWNEASVNHLYEMPFTQLILKAATIHAENFAADEIELCTLLSIKTGACPEDCGYCSQSGHYQTQIEKDKLCSLDEVIARAKFAKENGSHRFCMGAAWRNPPKKDFPKVLEMIKAVKEIGLETCVTLGMLNEEQAADLHAAGLDFYNHNLDTSPDYYQKIISTRTYQDRLDTLDLVKKSGINVCCGGIISMGETRKDRINFLLQLVNLPEPPKSVPINKLIPMAGTPLANTESIDDFEFIRTIAIARIMMPAAIVRLSAGRITMSESMQALCFLAGANSMWLGEKLLTAKNPDQDNDLALLQKLGLKPKSQLAHVEQKN